jgi:hypothetical protein
MCVKYDLNYVLNVLTTYYCWDFRFMYLMFAAVRDLNYVNCLINDMLNCLCFIKKTCVKGMIHEMKCILF